MLEPYRADQFIFAALNAPPAVADGRIYQGVAPEGAALPFVVFQMLAGTDLAQLGAFRVWANLLYLIKATGQGSSFAALAPLADAIDARLHRASGTTADGRVLTCVREEAHTMVEVTDGRQWRHAGGVFRLLVQAP
ncbi:MAG TPA: hypothetical protein VG370_35005 [Chloroflexota bacterium]|nr:hypothetical protein [Chloroflexota bacterium]